MAAVSSKPLSPKDARVEDQDQDVFDGEDVFEASEEGRELPMNLAKKLKMPSETEVEAHNKTHIPFRSWCKWCVAARGANLPHRARPEGQGFLKNEIAADYCFLRDAAGGPSQPVLVGRDRRTGVFFGHAVPLKGAGVDWIAGQMVRDIYKCGYYGRVVLRSDQEPALQDLLEEVARKRGDLPTVIESSPVGESQSNGFIERAVRSVEEMVRTHKLALESRLGERIAVDHPAIAWLIEHSVDLLNKCQMGKDGRTPYERLKGKRYGGTFMDFGCPVMLRVTDKPQGGLMQERWVEGTWLGMRWSTWEHLVSRRSDGVVVRTRAVRQMPRPAQMSDLESIVGQPCAPQGVQRLERAEVQRPSMTPEANGERPLLGPDPFRPIPRAFRITKDMLEKHGYSDRCVKCRMMRQGLQQGTMGHSVECRKRMEALVAKDEEYQSRLEQANARKNQYLAEEQEEDVKKRKAASDSISRPATAPVDSTGIDPGMTGGQPGEPVEIKGQSSSSSQDPMSTSTEVPGSPITGGAKRKAEEDLAEESERCERPERGDELPLPDVSLTTQTRPESERKSVSSTS